MHSTAPPAVREVLRQLLETAAERLFDCILDRLALAHQSREIAVLRAVLIGSQEAKLGPRRLCRAAVRTNCKELNDTYMP